MSIGDLACYDNRDSIGTGSVFQAALTGSLRGLSSEHPRAIRGERVIFPDALFLAAVHREVN
jgi:hypothetical protein